MATLNILSICGSLRKGSFNAMVQRLLPSLAPDGMTIKPAPSFADFPLYNADVQNSTGFPAPVKALADAIRAADGVIFCSPEYNFSIPGGLKNAIDWVSRLPSTCWNSTATTFAANPSKFARRPWPASCVAAKLACV